MRNLLFALMGLLLLFFITVFAAPLAGAQTDTTCHLFDGVGGSEPKITVNSNGECWWYSDSLFEALQVTHYRKAVIVTNSKTCAYMNMDGSIVVEDSALAIASLFQYFLDRMRQDSIRSAAQANLGMDIGKLERCFDAAQDILRVVDVGGYVLPANKKEFDRAVRRYRRYRKLLK